MFSRVLTLVIACTVGTMVLAQGNLPEIDFGKVPKADLQMTAYSPDTAAEAVVLADFGNINFRFDNDAPYHELERHRRIKILKRSGFDYGDVSISFYSENRLEEIKKIDAVVHNPDGSSTKLKKRDFFEEEYNDTYTRLKFTFPNLQEGSVIEYRYTLSSEYIFAIDDWYFQQEIPTRYSQLKITIPEWYDYVKITQGREMDVNTVIQSQMRYLYRQSGSQGMRSQSGHVNLNTKTYVFAMRQVPAMKAESFITTMDDYLAKVRMQLRGTNFDNIYRPQLNTWEETANELMENGSFGEQITRRRNYKDAFGALEPELSAMDNDRDKARLIYQYVNSRVEWNGDYGLFSDTDLKNAYEEGTGNGATINLLLVALMKEAGLEAYPVLISTRGHGKMTELYPLMSQFNHTMAFVQFEDGALILDGGNPHRPMGMIRQSALNGKAWLVHPTAQQWLKIGAMVGASTYFAKMNLDADGHLSGTITEKFEGYNAAAIRGGLDEDGPEKVIGTLFDEKYPESKIEQIELSEADDPTQDLRADMSVTIPNFAQQISGRIYLDPNIVRPFEESPFKLEDREYPVEIPYPLHENFILNLSLPEGYTLEDQPEPFKVSMPGGAGEFSYNITPSETSIQIVSQFQLNKTTWLPEEYDSLREFIDYVIEKTSEQIVLTRKT